MAIYLARRWNRAPSGPVEIDRRNALADGLITAGYPTARGVATPYGIAGAMTTFTSDDAFATGPFTIGARLYYGAITGPAWSSHLYMAGGNSFPDDWDRIGITLNGSGAQRNSFFAKNANTTSAMTGNNQVINALTDTYISVSSTASNATLFESAGIGKLTFTSNTITNNTNVEFVTGRRRTLFAGNLAASILAQWYALWSRQLQAEERRELKLNPWQLWAPRKVVLYSIPSDIAVSALAGINAPINAPVNRGIY